jgi:geranylgeranyl diphosphate synthase type II
MDTQAALQTARQLIDACVQGMLTERRQRAREIGVSYEQFWQRIEQVVMAGGKRLRPLLTIIGGEGQGERIIPVAAAQELIHIAMLIHDDIIDQDFVRHGQKNISGLYRDAYDTYLTEPLRTHYANSAAILAGDALISESYRLIYSAGFDGEVTRRLVNQLATSIYEVIGGELLDVEAAFVSDQVFDPLQVYRYKTASYSFVGPLLSGAYCAETDTVTIETMREFAHNIGIAYQIQDDLLGVFGDEATTGKSTLSDLREGKRTLLVQYHEERMDEAQHQRFMAFGSISATDSELKVIVRDMQVSQAREKTTEVMRQYFSEARNRLLQLPSGKRTDELLALTDQIEGRAS